MSDQIGGSPGPAQALTAPDRRAAVYLHVPFCRARCAYCDFATTAGMTDFIPAYVAALCREIEAAGERWGPLRVPTIYLGGGTPSLLSLPQLRRIVETLRAAFRISDGAEITLEANPGTVSISYLDDLRALGVNRLSLGVQSAHDDELRLLGRIHTWDVVTETVSTARAVGFDNLSLDFIYGLPDQTLPRWRETLEAALALAPSHLSLYGLSVEAGTPLARRIARGALPAPDPDDAADMYELAEEMLAQAGYFHYEISNWARADAAGMIDDLGWRPRPEAPTERVSAYVCRHNLVYWRNEPYLGLGAAAASWWDGCRWANVRHPEDYVDRVERGALPAVEREAIDLRLEMGETMMMGLRLAEGVSDARFRARFGTSLEAAFAAELGRLKARGLLAWDRRVARLTARGRLLGNQVFGRFLPDSME